MPDILAIFRFHDHFDVVADRLRALHTLNPGTPIIGFYGGPKANRKAAQQLDWDDCYILKDKIDQWKWQYADMHIRTWYRKRGRKHSFTHLCVTEWDLLFTAPLATLYQPGTHALLMTDVKPREVRLHEGWPWLNEPYLTPEREAYETWLRRKLHWNGQAHIGLMPGALISRPFLDAYARVKPPRGANDEYRLATLASAFGMTVGETDFNYPHCYNCDRQAIPWDTIIQASSTPDGPRVFHPVYETAPASLTAPAAPHA